MKAILLVLISFVSLCAWATVDLTQKVSVTAKNEPIGTVLKIIATQASVDFNINIPTSSTKKVSIDVKKASLKDVMDTLTKMGALTWAFDGDHTIKITSI